MADSGIAFGPVPSRRLGASLGINNIPPKACTYSCIYCQLGRTNRMQCERRPFYDQEEIRGAVEFKINETLSNGGTIDYLSFVPDGEPTLDEELYENVRFLKTLGIKVAVITNASLIWRSDVKDALRQADWVSLKVDSVDERTWRAINRPYRTLQLPSILRGMEEFAESYDGKMVSETMLVEGVNDTHVSIEATAMFLSRLGLAKAYLSVPTRPPAESWVRLPCEDFVHRAYQVFLQRIGHVECLIEQERGSFGSLGNAAEELLSITAVHPMRGEAVRTLLQKTGEDWSLVRDLIDQGQLVELEYQGEKFYMRRLQGRPR